MFPDEFLTSRLRLRQIEPRDRDAIFTGYAQDGEVAKYMSWRPHGGPEETAAYIASCLAAAATGSARTYVVLGRDDGALRGAFELRRPMPFRIDVGYTLARPFWGQGLMTEALREAVVWAKQQDGLFRIGCLCDVDNIGSARVMEKSGMTREGVLRRWLLHPNVSDEPRDCYSYAITW
jgi:ribosomal-protein-alanine N-acetyltransferase